MVIVLHVVAYVIPVYGRNVLRRNNDCEGATHCIQVKECSMTTLRKLTLDDLWSFKEMGAIALSPNGRHVAFVISTLDKAKNERQSAIWLLQLDEQGHAAGEPRQLTSGAKNDTNPVWAPDSKQLLFLSNREEEKNQLWLINTGGGEARKVTKMLRGVNEAAWSPDGQWIAFTSPVTPSDEDDLLTGLRQLDADAQKKREEEERLRPRTITRIWYRLDGRGLYDAFSQLFVMQAPTADGQAIDPATIRRLTSGDYDHIMQQWTPDSLEIGVLCNREDDRDRSGVVDLWAINRETANAHRISDGTLETLCYSWSPDSRSAVLVAGQDMRTAGSTNAALYLFSRDGGHNGHGGHGQILTADADNMAYPSTLSSFGWPGPYLPQWSPDGQRIYFLLMDRGCVDVCRVDVEQRKTTTLAKHESVAYFQALLPDERGLLLAQSHPVHPWELDLLPLNSKDAGELLRLTHLYDHQLAGFAWSKLERFRYRGANNDEIDGWLMRPIGAREGARYPLVVSIHGGPQWAFGAGMSLTHQYLAAQGFAVFFCNPHGSTGQGQAFMREVEGDWGGWDYQDIMLGVDECIARGVADPEHLLVTGYSYGGYMSMFIIGQTGRFKAAVPMAGVSNLSSFVGTSDVGFWQALQSKGYPWDPEREAYYSERSPLTNAPRVTTPTRFIHPENDLRCPIEQSEQFYMRLKMIGKVPVEFARVPSAWHVGAAKPSQEWTFDEMMLEWFRKYVEIRPGEYE